MPSEKITFGRQGQVRRGDIIAGWIDRLESGMWLLRFTPASGIPGGLWHYRLLREAKTAAIRALGVANAT